MRREDTLCICYYTSPTRLHRSYAATLFLYRYAVTPRLRRYAAATLLRYLALGLCIAKGRKITFSEEYLPLNCPFMHLCYFSASYLAQINVFSFFQCKSTFNSHFCNFFILINVRLLPTYSFCLPTYKCAVYLIVQQTSMIQRVSSRLLLQFPSGIVPQT